MKALRIALTVSAAAASLLLGTGMASATAIPAAVHHAGSCTARGDFATCDASGTATRPHRIRVHVHARPDQHVLVSWDTVCTRGSGAGSRSGQFTAFTPVNRIIRHPYTHPDSCIVAAGAQLQDGGHWIHVNITYRRW